MFIISVLEVLSAEFRVGSPEEILYADDLVFACETTWGLLSKDCEECYVMRVNVTKTKVMISEKFPFVERKLEAEFLGNYKH